MTSVLSAHSLSKAYGTQVLFENISFTLNSDDRIGLIGPNGAGKTSLLKILAGLEHPDSGNISKKQGLRVGYSGQAPKFPSEPLEQFLVNQLASSCEHAALIKARILLGKGEFNDFLADASLLSGGWKKRLDIIRALMNDPDFLFLDEPTNHLDLEGILWLENFLKRINVPFLVISHDRYFLENVANEIMELNKCYPGGIFISRGNMTVFTKQVEDFHLAQEKKQRELSFKVREETDWLRTTPKARTTKSRSRIDKALGLIEELSEHKQRNKKETAGISFTSSERETRKLIVVKNISKSLGGKVLFSQLDLTLTPGMRLGIVGKNGTGKTTLLKILYGALPSDMGTIKYAQDLRLVYFDQHREEIPPHITLKEALCPSGDMVNYQGQQIHVNGWAKRFLFSPDKLNLPVGYLSGGERARILMAKLMLQPADVLFLDEPTNDLDIPTLEVIEESLMSFQGAVVLISHDRCLMDRVCTQIIGFKGKAEHHFFAAYEQWEKFNSSMKKEEKLLKEVKPEDKKSSKKLTYNEKKELETIEQKIHEAEQRLETLQEKLSGEESALSSYAELGKAQELVEGLYARWQDLLDRS